MDRSLFRYILRHSKAGQIQIGLMVAASLIFYFISLDVPKTIVNQAISGKAFAADGSGEAPFFRIAFTIPTLKKADPNAKPEQIAEEKKQREVVLFGGISMTRLPYLFAMSGWFLALVVINQAFKFYINTSKGKLGERLLRRLRYDLFDRILRFPTMHYRRVKSAEMATMIKDEVEPLGGFIGEAFATPAQLGGQALVAILFIMLQSWQLGIVALVVVGLQVGLVPRLRRRVLILGRERQLGARKLAGRIAEIVDGAREIRAHDTTNYERAEISDRLGKIFWIRFEIYQRKFFAKNLNNFLSQLAPFIFYSAGGYLAITSEAAAKVANAGIPLEQQVPAAFTIGALIAVINAYKDLPAPMKDLLDWDQQRLDIQIKYEQVIDQFQPDGILDPVIQSPDKARDKPLEGRVIASGAAVSDDSGIKMLDGISCQFDVKDRVAIVGPGGGGRAELAQLIAGLLRPTAGSVQIGDLDVGKAPEAVLGRRISYVGPDTYLFPVSLRENLLYPLKHRPVAEATYDEARKAKIARDRAESEGTGNALFDINADWLDYTAAGVTNREELDNRLIELLDTVDFGKDVYELGLRSVIDPAGNPVLVDKVLKVRREVRKMLGDPAFEGLVETFDPEKYNRAATVGENLLFGVPMGDAFKMEKLAQNAYVQQVLEEVGLFEVLFERGKSVAATMIELFADLPPGHEFFDQYSFISYDELPEYKALLARAATEGPNLARADKARFVAMTFKLLPTHRLDAFDNTLMDGILKARKVFAEKLPDNLRGAIEFFDADLYISAATLQDNILFGKVALGLVQADTRVAELISDVLEESHMRADIIRAGLEFQVGIGGGRLSAAQRQKVAIIRAVLKKPDLYILNEATGSLDGSTQTKILNDLLGEKNSAGVIWVLQRASLAQRFKQVFYVRNGRIQESGTFDDLNKDGTAFHKLVAAE